MPYNSSYTGAEIDSAIGTVKDELTQGATTEILVGGGVSTDPVFTTATGTGAPARAGSPTFTTKITTPIIDLTGGQIAFPAGVGHYSADVNTLDDYEEGTFTPYVWDADTGGNQSATAGTGYYTKIGNLVTVFIQIANIDTTGLTAGNVAYIRALPFTVGAIRGVGSVEAQNVTITKYLVARAANTTTTCTLRNNATGATGNDVLVSEIADDTADLRLTVSYII